MKHTLTLLVLFVALIAQSCSNEKIENDWTRDNIQGKVLSYSEFSYEAENRFGNIEKGERKRQPVSINDYDHQIKYDEKGNVTEYNRYNSDGSLDGKYTSKYDEKGNITERVLRSDSAQEKRKYTSKYDEKGNKIENNRYNSDGSLSFKYTSKYDEKGNKIENNRYNSDGSLDSKYTYKYEFDKQSNWIKKIEFLDGIPEYILERQYEYYD